MVYRDRGKLRGQGRTNRNGYGKQHQMLRAQYARRMRDGETFDCWRCGYWVDPAKPWDLGHDDVDRSRYRGPEHRWCNRGAKHNGNVNGDARPRVSPSREW